MDRSEAWRSWSRLSVATVTLLLVAGCQVPFAVYNFNNGTTQGWTFDGVYDDSGKKYDGSSFPPQTLQNFQGTQLVFFPNQLGLTLKQLGFPGTSSYWRVDLVSPALGTSWDGLSGMSAVVRDQIGLVDNVLEAGLFLRYSVDGVVTETPATAAFNPDLPHDKWTTIGGNVKPPKDAELQHVILRLRGQWATPGSPVIQMYEGQVYVEDVTAYRYQ